jgi:tRNA-splicing endonuclease subunit Sen54
MMTIFLSSYAALWLLVQYFLSCVRPRPHRPYDAIYATLPPISSFSETMSNNDQLSIAFEVWRPNPSWKRKSPGPPDFHICVVDAREQFPSLAQLEQLYNSVAEKYPLGGKNGKVVVAVVDNGVSNYLTLDNNLFNDTRDA